MSISIIHDGREIFDDDIYVALNRGQGTVLVRAALDHLELLAQIPEMCGEGTSAAARAALNLLEKFDVRSEIVGAGVEWTEVEYR